MPASGQVIEAARNLQAENNLLTSIRRGGIMTKAALIAAVAKAAKLSKRAGGNAVNATF